MKNRLLLTVLGFLLLNGCTKDASDTVLPASKLNLSITYKVDNSPLVFDTVVYTNDAGNQYSVTTLHYYLSKLSLIKPDSSLVELLGNTYVDAAEASVNSISLPYIPEGNYIGLSVYIGVDSIHNVADGLPATADNLNMIWPEAMGGGYHHFKMEGMYRHTPDSLLGYTIHLGLNDYLVKAKIWGSLTFDHSTVSKTLVMNLNEWFRAPQVYNFETDGAATMSSMMAMQKIAANGTDVLKFQ